MVVYKETKLSEILFGSSRFLGLNDYVCWEKGMKKDKRNGHGSKLDVGIC